MGGFFLTNNESDNLEEKVKQIFLAKGMEKYDLFNFDKFKVFYFHKIGHSEFKHVFKSGDDYLVGVGVFFYKNKFGIQAQEEIYSDLKNNLDYSIFNQVLGHFNFILYINGELSVIADKTGTYHSYYCVNDGYQYVSTSFYSIIEFLEKITISKQELIEFMMFEAFIGPKTAVKEIEYLGFGQVHLLTSKDKKRSKQYYVEKNIDKPTNIEMTTKIIKQYFEVFRDLNISVTCDLSAGYDTRLVCAIFKNMKLKHTLNTNENVDDPKDSEVPRTIAKEEGVEIFSFTREEEKYAQDELLNESFNKNELMRDNFRARYTAKYFEDKTEKFDMIVGGYGGEIYRDVKYRNTKSYNSLITKQYSDYTVRLILKGRDWERYTRKLKKKFKGFLENNRIRPTKEDLERIYYYLKMMYWGGSRITYFNQYGYRFHPLLDHEIAGFAFDIPKVAKDYEKFNMEIIAEFDEKFASYNSNYNYNFIWEDSKRDIIIPKIPIKTQLMKLISQIIRFIIRDEFFLYQLRSTFRRQPSELLKQKGWRKHLEDELLFTDFFGNRIHKIVIEEEMLSGVFTVEKFLERFKEKIVK